MSRSTPDQDLAEYYAHLAAHGDEPIGTIPARLLMACIAATHAEVRESANSIVVASIDAMQHIAGRLREALALMDAGDVAEARTILAEIVGSLDGSLLTSETHNAH